LNQIVKRQYANLKFCGMRQPNPCISHFNNYPTSDTTCSYYHNFTPSSPTRITEASINFYGILRNQKYIICRCTDLIFLIPPQVMITI